MLPLLSKNNLIVLFLICHALTLFSVLAILCMVPTDK